MNIKILNKENIIFNLIKKFATFTALCKIISKQLITILIIFKVLIMTIQLALLHSKSTAHNRTTLEHTPPSQTIQPVPATQNAS